LKVNEKILALPVKKMPHLCSISGYGPVGYSLQLTTVGRQHVLPMYYMFRMILGLFSCDL